MSGWSIYHRLRLLHAVYSNYNHNNYEGYATRLCTIDGKWSETIDVIECEKVEFVQLHALVSLAMVSMCMCLLYQSDRPVNWKG